MNWKTICIKQKGEASLRRPQETNYYAAYLTYKPDYVRSLLLYLMDHSCS